MITDKNYCMNSFLMYRFVADDEYQFSEMVPRKLPYTDFLREEIHNSSELYTHIEKIMEKETKDGRVALALSGGIDSAILAKFMPPGSTAYTFKCVVPEKDVVDETKRAAKIAEEANLIHKIVEINWEDVEKSLPVLMKHKGAPIHSIEAQIYVAALRAKEDGFDKLIFGENADIIYGGMDGLLKEDWFFGDFVDRYSYILPYKVLRKGSMILDPFLQFEKNGRIDAHDFVNTYFRKEALGTYINACETAGVEFISPFASTKLGVPINLERIRKGDTKYIVREVYHLLFPKLDTPEKIPMPRPLDEWMQDWAGPKRPEFFPDCHLKLSGEKKWLLYILEKFLDLIEQADKKVSL